MAVMFVATLFFLLCAALVWSVKLLCGLAMGFFA